MSNWAPILFLANLLRPVLEGIESFVHDYGLAVVLLTVLVRLVLFPLTVKQARFAYKNRIFMKAYKEVQAKCKDKPEKLKEEAAKLTLEHKFNPFSMMGTMILQMPIFAAVYAVFYHFGTDITTSLIPWVSSLGMMDPSHVLPLLVAGLSAAGVLVPMISPEGAEGVQQAGKMMPILIMFPVMLFFLWKAPVAIALYMGASSVWGMAERLFLRSRFAVRALRLDPAMQPAFVSPAAAGESGADGERKQA